MEAEVENKAKVISETTSQFGEACAQLREAWNTLEGEERISAFLRLKRDEAEEFFASENAVVQVEVLLGVPLAERRMWIRSLAPDDVADVVQHAPAEDKDTLVNLLDGSTRREVRALLAYEEDEAGGLMSPRYSRLRSDMQVDEALSYLRRQAVGKVETIQYAYVLDAEQRLLGVVSLRDLFGAADNKVISEIMEREPITVPEEMNQEEVGALLTGNDLLAIPVVNADGVMKGIVTVDDIVDVLKEEATEDIQKLGAVAALDAPYFEITFLEMIKKRAGWLLVLFIGEMLTASAMGYFEDEIARAVVLALFIPLIVSSGGNSGSQATTLVIRALALGEVRTRDWLRVLRREILTGFALGVILGSVGMLRILVWGTYGEHVVLLSIAVAFSVMLVVLWGTIAGSMLPLILRRFGLDPASASAPFVATVVDVTGLIIYFSVAAVLLSGTLL